MIYQVNIIIIIIPSTTRVMRKIIMTVVGSEVHLVNIIIHITSCNINLCMFE